MEGKLVVFFVIFGLSNLQVGLSENKTVGEFCEQRIASPVYTKLADLDTYAKEKNESGDLKQDFEKIPEEKLYEWEDGEKEANKPKNRYPEYLPYDHSRVKLNEIGDASVSDYINANYVDGVNKSKRYIATQGPVRGSANDFWRMVWEAEAAQIVMLTRLADHGKEKCFKYWPDDYARYGLIEVAHEKSDFLSDYVIRTFLIQYRREVRRVTHYHFIAWPDMGVPEFPETLLNFVRQVRHSKKYKDTKPLIVHCSGGMGRTGTFILTDSMLSAAEAVGEVDVTAQVCRMRKNRVNLVETFPQFVYAHQVVAKSAGGQTDPQ